MQEEEDKFSLSKQIDVGVALLASLKVECFWFFLILFHLDLEKVQYFTSHLLQNMEVRFHFLKASALVELIKHINGACFAQSKREISFDSNLYRDEVIFCFTTCTCVC